MPRNACTSRISDSTLADGRGPYGTFSCTRVVPLVRGLLRSFLKRRPKRRWGVVTYRKVFYRMRPGVTQEGFRAALIPVRREGGQSDA